MGALDDNVLTADEIHDILWLSEKLTTDNEQLRGTYPFDELSSLIVSILADGKVDDDERDMLTAFMSDFLDSS